MEVPKAFIVTAQGTDELKAVSADDAQIWVRTFDEPHEGSLAFWTDALRNDFVDNRGYTLIEEGTTQDGDGHEGSELTFEVTVGGRAQRYAVSLFWIPGSFLFWTSNTIGIVEFVAPRDVFEGYREEVRKAVHTLSL
jgi:hypothetical protein